MLFVESLNLWLVIGHVVMAEFTRGISATIFKFPIIIRIVVLRVNVAFSGFLSVSQ